MISPVIEPLIFAVISRRLSLIFYYAGFRIYISPCFQPAITILITWLRWCYIMLICHYFLLILRWDYWLFSMPSFFFISFAIDLRCIICFLSFFSFFLIFLHDYSCLYFFILSLLAAFVIADIADAASSLLLALFATMMMLFIDVIDILRFSLWYFLIFSSSDFHFSLSYRLLICYCYYWWLAFISLYRHYIIDD